MTKSLFVVCCLAVAGLTRAAESSFVPKDLPGCVWWIKAEQGVLKNDRGEVTKWLDQSGKGHDVDQVVGTPPVLAKGPNGRPVVRFSPEGHMLAAHEFTSRELGAHSLFLLARWTDTDPARCQRILSSKSCNWAFGYMEGHDQAWIADAWVYHGGWNVYGEGSPNSQWHLHTGTVTGDAKPLASFWKDDTKLMEERPQADIAKLQPRQIQLNGVDGNHQTSRCEIAEAVLFNRALSGAELQRMWRYFQARYAIGTPASPAPRGLVAEQRRTAFSGKIAEGPFQPDWRTFRQYDCPEWFRDAKFGIWAHWSPQCQPEQGDWYAYHLYKQGSRQYQYHVDRYGHPSKVGYKDICNQWKAEKWDPEKLIQLYKRAGARYFVALANHHCNFDCWDSPYQPWNSVNIGPKKDIVGVWAETARRHGLRFGVTVHSARAWEWYEVAHGADATGPLKGVPYDGALTKADGKGTWWEGYDPADLYGPHGAARTPQARQAYIEKWFNRTKDLVDKYRPDLLYFDDTVPPLGDAGMSVVAHFCNANMAWHQGRLEAVFNTKIYDFHPPKEFYKYLVNDFEGGRAAAIQPYPWQTDTCIGNWHYYRDARYRTAGEVIRELIDIVSKNGNLLLNLPLKGDGSLDDAELEFLAELTKWMDVNGEGIYGTRPWKMFGEGSVRFTRKGKTLYAFLLEIPRSDITIRSLGTSAEPETGRIANVALLGADAKLDWTRQADGLVVKCPKTVPCGHAIALKITFTE
jgi:alpha-L-fucosidase